MKSTRSSEFFSDTAAPANKRARKNTPHQLQVADLPDEMWIEILKNVSKKDLRELAEVNSSFFELTTRLIARNSLFNKTAWPAINYTKRSKTSSSDVFKKIKQHGSHFSVFNLPNGDVVVGEQRGGVFVLKLRDNAWECFQESSTNCHATAINDALLLSSGHLLTCGEDGAKIWDRANQQLIQHLQVNGRGPIKKLTNAFELTNGDLLIGNEKNSFHIWEKTQDTARPYQYSTLLDTEHSEKLSQFTLRDNLLVSLNSTHIIFQDLPLLTTRRVKVSDIRDRFIQALRSLISDVDFTSSYITYQDILAADELIANPKSENVTICPKKTPQKLLNEGSLIVWIGRFRFMINLFDPTISPYFLGICGFQHHIKCIDEKLIVTRRKMTDDTTHNDGFVEILSDWDSSTNEFNRRATFPSKKSKLLSNGLVFIESTREEMFTYNVQEDTSQDLSLEESSINIICDSLKNNDLVGMKPYVNNTTSNRFTIWNGQTGMIKTTFDSKNDEYMELANGDILTYECGADTTTTHIHVHRFDTL